MSKVLERWPKPVRSVLESRPTIILKEPLVRSLPLKGQTSGFFAADLPPGVTYEEAVEVIKRSDWAQNMSKGMCEKLFGAKPGTKAFDRCLERVSDRVARGLLK